MINEIKKYTFIVLKIDDFTLASCSAGRFLMTKSNFIYLPTVWRPIGLIKNKYIEYFKGGFVAFHYPRPVLRPISPVLPIIDVPTLWDSILVYLTGWALPGPPPPTSRGFNWLVQYFLLFQVPGNGGSDLQAKLDKPSTNHFWCWRTTNDYYKIWLNVWQLIPFAVSCFADNFRYVLLLTFMLLVANLANTIWCENPKRWLKPWQMGTYLRVLSESYPMNTNMTGFYMFFKDLCIFVLWTKVASALEGIKVILYSAPLHVWMLFLRDLKQSNVTVIWLVVVVNLCYSLGYIFFKELKHSNGRARSL